MAGEEEKECILRRKCHRWCKRRMWITKVKKRRIKETEEMSGEGGYQTTSGKIGEGQIVLGKIKSKCPSVRRTRMENK